MALLYVVFKDLDLAKLWVMELEAKYMRLMACGA
jgi:hypothetical protein